MDDSRRPPYGYSVGLMTEYVAEMTSRLVMSPTPFSARFHILLYGLLTQTELPDTTILLGLTYLSKRMPTLPMPIEATQPVVAEREAWEMLVVAVMLGSKYLDDGTYKNKTWAIVSDIPRADLDRLERQWLGTVEWSLRVNLDSDTAYWGWIANWQNWLCSKARQMKLNLIAAWLPVYTTPSYVSSRADLPVTFPATLDTRHRSVDAAKQPMPVAWGISLNSTAPVQYPVWPSMSSSMSNPTCFSWEGGSLLGDLGEPVNFFT
ncbi:cyclin-like protein [Sporothrix eucalyptigena]